MQCVEFFSAKAVWVTATLAEIRGVALGKKAKIRINQTIIKMS